MPELPEVETVCRGIAKAAVGKKIEQVWVSNKKMRFPAAQNFEEKLLSREILNVKRRSKYVLIELDNEYYLVIHLGMSGKILFQKTELYETKKHDHLIIDFNDESNLVFNDARRFGMYDVVAKNKLDSHKLFAKLGVEPLEDEFDGKYLKNKFKNKAVNIKQAIMDAKNLVGVGNIYAAESLFRAGINPKISANKLSLDKLELLSQKIKEVLKEAIESGGSTLRDFVRSDGDIGYFQNKHYVYGRENEPCFICGEKVKKIVQQGRSTFYCPKCQPLKQINLK